ncbi:carboxypeptidase-like regulatory domain-containing protein (plasmid) [Deinococcus radiomollis]|uniref:carboxypeptidase-like regulatory domain-containing protein n=1 Tax=Deinococcus radiomollis TaxID=468916 RepID=UPI003892A82D
MTQHVHTQQHVAPQLLDIATVADRLTEIYNGFTAAKDTENTAAFVKMSKNEYLGWRGDQVKANDFLNAASALLTPPTPVVEVDPWDIGEPEPAPVPVAVEPEPVAVPVQAAPAPVQAAPAPVQAAPAVQEPEPVQAEEVPDTEVVDTAEEGEVEDDEEGEGDTQAEAESPAEVTAEPEAVTAAPVIMAQPDADPGSLFGQLRALFDRGAGSGFRIMGSFLPNGQQRLVIIDEHLSAQKLDTFSLTATDAEFDTELAPLLSEHLAGPAHTVRTLAEQVAQAAKTQAASSKKPVTPAKTTTTTTPAATKPAAKAVPVSSTAKITLTPPVAASGAYDGPSSGKVKFANGAANLMGLKPGEYTLKVTADGHLDAEQKFTVAGSGTVTVPVTLVSAGLDF